MSQHGERIVQGFVGEMIGASVMTVIRMTAHRAGLIDKTVPQAMTETLSRRVRPLPGGTPGHQAIAELLHLGYGALWGAGAALSFRDRPTPAAGALFGLVTLLRPTRPPWRATPGEAVVNIAAHLAYGLTTALVVDELAEQRRLGPTSDRERHAARVA